ncbi:MAG: hypothetical protein ACI4HQ_09990 [Acetatifactor sp.]
MKKQQKAARFVVHGLIILYTIACLWLFYHQSIADLTVEGEIPFQSDLPLHISMIIEDGWYYSFTAYVYKVLHMLFRGSTLGICIFLALVETATVYATERLVCHLGKYRENTWFTLLLALSLNFVMPCYIRAVGEFRYVSYQSGNIWHNSTYICMRLAALFTLLYYFKLEKKYRDGLTWKEWCCFAVMNIVCTGIKPSFLLAFSPIMGLFLLVDLMKKVPLKRILVFGSSLLPSGLVILWQNAVLFGEDTGNGMGFRPWYSFSLHTQIPKLAVVCSVLFCIFVLFMKIGDLRKERETLFLVLMTVLGFLEALCLVESGSRGFDGNFLWGYSFCLFVLFALCAVKWLRMGAERGWQRVLRAGLGVLYGWHLYCGLYFFISLVCGAGYWMR